jgi:gamma-glutamylcyclotransferase (GGCT)/AIG2-like uncharacterized protein YtfP
VSVVAERCLLFVYGTLLRGEPGHHHLGDARFLGAYRTPPQYRMVVVDWYPAISVGGGTVEGEVFEVSAAQLATLDAYEGDEYVRELIETPWGRAFIYVAITIDDALVEVPSGRWLDVAERYRPS